LCTFFAIFNEVLLSLKNCIKTDKNKAPVLIFFLLF
jgi:hypothetical protein